jgi:hypothetical protein
VAKGQKTQNGRPRELASVCVDGLLAEAISIGPDQPLQYAVLESGKVDLRASVLFRGQEIVPPRDRNGLVTKGCVLLPGKPTPYGTQERLLGELETFIHRYCDLAPFWVRLSALYPLMTWVYDRFTAVPYLRFLGEPQTGKSRCLQVIGHLCYKAIMAGGSTTASPLFRLLEVYGGTFVFDEADFRHSDAWCEIVKILNCGYMRGAPVLRSDKSGDSYEPRAFDVFGPKVIATRRRFEDGALESRCLTLETPERPVRYDIPRQLPQLFFDEASALRSKLLQWRFESHARVRPDESALLDLEPRMAQIATPLYNLATKSFREELLGFLQRTGAEDRSGRPQAIVVEAIARLAEKNGQTLHVKSVAEEASALSRERGEDFVPNPKAAGAIVRSLGLHTRRTRAGYVFEVESDTLARLKDKYGVNV